MHSPGERGQHTLASHLTELSDSFRKLLSKRMVHSMSTAFVLAILVILSPRSQFSQLAKSTVVLRQVSKCSDCSQATCVLVLVLAGQVRQKLKR